MKKTLFLLSVVVSALFIVSCNKTVPEITKYPITGLWIGTYSISAGADEGDSLYYSYHITSDSTIQMQGLGADGNTYYGIGSWSYQGGAFSATITTSNLSQEGAVQKVTAVQDKDKLVGTVESVSGVFQADFRLTRTN